MDNEPGAPNSEDAAWAAAEEQQRLDRVAHFHRLVGNRDDAAIQTLLRQYHPALSTADIALARQGALLGFRFAAALSEALDMPMSAVAGAWPPTVAVLLNGMAAAILDLERRLPRDDR